MKTAKNLFCATAAVLLLTPFTALPAAEHKPALWAVYYAWYQKGWDAAHAKWKELGVKTIDLQIAKGQAHSFFNKEPWRTVTLLEADRFLVRHGFLTGEPTLQAPVTGEKLIPVSQQ